MAIVHPDVATILRTTFSCSFHILALLVPFDFGYPAGRDANYMQTEVGNARKDEVTEPAMD